MRLNANSGKDTSYNGLSTSYRKESNNNNNNHMPWNHRIIEVRGDLKRLPGSMSCLKQDEPCGYSGLHSIWPQNPPRMESTRPRLDNLFQYLSLLVVKRFLLTPSVNLSCFNFCLLPTVLPHCTTEKFQAPSS